VDDDEGKFAKDFATVWSKVINLGRFELK